MASVEGVTIRRAEAEDTDKILEIDVSEEDIRHKEFDDLADDLDDEDDDVFDDEDTDLFVAETEDKVIGFVMLDQVDKDGEGGGMISDMRVDKSWRDAGVYEMMYQHVMEYGKNETEMKYIRTTVNKFPEGTNAEEICKVEYIAFEGEAETLRETLEAVPGMEELPLSSVIAYKPRLIRAMLRPGVGENVLTHGLLFADGDTYTLCKDNLYDIEEENTCVFVDNNKPVQSISFGNDSESDSGTFYDIEVNCKDVDLMKSHILRQMQDACETVEGHIVFSILTLDFKDEIRAFCQKIEGLVEAEKYNETAVWSKIILD